MNFEKRKEYEEYLLFLQNIRTNNFSFPLVGEQRDYVSFILKEVRETLKSYIPSIQEIGPEGFYNRCNREIVTLKEKLSALNQNLRRKYLDQANKYYVSTKIGSINSALANVNTIFPQLAKDSGDKETIQRCKIESGRLAALKLELEMLQEANKEKFSFCEHRSRIDGIIHKLQYEVSSDLDLRSKQLQIESLQDELAQRGIQEEIDRLESNLIMYEMYALEGSISNKHMKYCLFKIKRLEHILLYLLRNKTRDELSFCVATTTSKEFEGRDFFEKVTAPAVIRIEDTNQIIIYGTDLHKKELFASLSQEEFNKLFINISFTPELSVRIDREIIRTMEQNNFHSLSYFPTEEDFQEIDEAMSEIEEALKELDKEVQDEVSEEVEQDKAATTTNEQDKVLLQDTSEPLGLLESTSVSFNLGELPPSPLSNLISQSSSVVEVTARPPFIRQARHESTSSLPFPTEIARPSEPGTFIAGSGNTLFTAGLVSPFTAPVTSKGGAVRFSTDSLGRQYSSDMRSGERVRGGFRGLFDVSSTPDAMKFKTPTTIEHDWFYKPLWSIDPTTVANRAQITDRIDVGFTHIKQGRGQFKITSSFDPITQATKHKLFLGGTMQTGINVVNVEKRTPTFGFTGRAQTNLFNAIVTVPTVTAEVERDSAGGTSASFSARSGFYGNIASNTATFKTEKYCLIGDRTCFSFEGSGSADLLAVGAHGEVGFSSYRTPDTLKKGSFYVASGVGAELIGAQVKLKVNYHESRHDSLLELIESLPGTSTQATSQTRMLDCTERSPQILQYLYDINRDSNGNNGLQLDVGSDIPAPLQLTYPHFRK